MGGWRSISMAAVMGCLALCPRVVAADAAAASLSVSVDEHPVPAPRGTHARVQLAPVVGTAIDLGYNEPSVAVGGVLGLDLPFHPRHEIGVRLGYVAHNFVRMGFSPLRSFVSGAIVYRWHPELAVDRLVTYFEIGGGLGWYGDGCGTDSCFSFGAQGTLSIGGELVFEPELSWFFGMQVDGYFTLFVNPFVQPVVITGVRFG